LHAKHLIKPRHAANFLQAERHLRDLRLTIPVRVAPDKLQIGQ